MKTSAQYEVSKDLSVLLIGPPQSGKTNVAMGFPNPWFASTDGKLSNAVSRFPGKKFWYSSFNDVPENQRWLRLLSEADAAAKEPEIKTLVIDHLTDVQSYLQAFILQTAGSKLTIAGERVFEKQHWQPFAVMLVRLINALKATGKYVVFICHESMDKDEATGQFVTQPNVGGQLRCSLPAHFQNVWRTETQILGDKVQYRVRTAPTHRTSFLGNALNLPPVWDFSWDVIQKKLEELK